MSNPLIPVARLGAADCPLGTARRICDEYVTPIPHDAADLLDLDGTAVVQRWTTLLTDGVPALTATSYLPVEVACGSTDDAHTWQNTDIGALALVGHTTRSQSMTHWTTAPTPGEATLFHLTEHDFLTMVSRKYLVKANGKDLPAGVILLAPCERLVLRSTADQWATGALPTVLLVSEREELCHPPEVPTPGHN